MEVHEEGERRQHQEGPASGHHNKGEGVQGLLVQGVRRKINLRGQIPGLRTVWPREDISPALMQKEKNAKDQGKEPAQIRKGDWFRMNLGVG